MTPKSVPWPPQSRAENGTFYSHANTTKNVDTKERQNLCLFRPTIRRRHSIYMSTLTKGIVQPRRPGKMMLHYTVGGTETAGTNSTKPRPLEIRWLSRGKHQLPSSLPICIGRDRWAAWLDDCYALYNCLCDTWSWYSVSAY